jgi:hypothetical protein
MCELGFFEKSPLPEPKIDLKMGDSSWYLFIGND